jgi:hypothetical protein
MGQALGVCPHRVSGDGSEWAPCANFSRGSKAPGLGAITSKLDESMGVITLDHPDLGSLTFNPDDEPQKLIDWAGGLIPKNRAPSHRVIRARAQAFTDSDFPSVTSWVTWPLTGRSRRGSGMAPRRIAGAVTCGSRGRNRGRNSTGSVGIFALAPRCCDPKSAPIAVLPPITTPRPARGMTISSMCSNSFGHRDFTVRARVIASGEVAIGDEVALSS